MNGSGWRRTALFHALLDQCETRVVIEGQSARVTAVLSHILRPIDTRDELAFVPNWANELSLKCMTIGPLTSGWMSSLLQIWKPWDVGMHSQNWPFASIPTSHVWKDCEIKNHGDSQKTPLGLRSKLRFTNFMPHWLMIPHWFVGAHCQNSCDMCGYSHISCKAGRTVRFQYHSQKRSSQISKLSCHTGSWYSISFAYILFYYFQSLQFSISFETDLSIILSFLCDIFSMSLSG